MNKSEESAQDACGAFAIAVSSCAKVVTVCEGAGVGTSVIDGTGVIVGDSVGSAVGAELGVARQAPPSAYRLATS